MTNESSDNQPRPSRRDALRDAVRKALVVTSGAGVIGAAGVLEGRREKGSELAPQIMNLRDEVRGLRETLSAREEEIRSLKEDAAKYAALRNSPRRLAGKALERLNELGTVVPERASRGIPERLVFSVDDKNNEASADFYLTNLQDPTDELEAQISAEHDLHLVGRYRGLGLGFDMPLPRERRENVHMNPTIHVVDTNQVFRELRSGTDIANVLTGLRLEAMKKLEACMQTLQDLGVTTRDYVVWKPQKGPEYIVEQGGQKLDRRNYESGNTSLAPLMETGAEFTFTGGVNRRQFSVALSAPQFVKVGGKSYPMGRLNSPERQKIVGYINGDIDSMD